MAFVMTVPPNGAKGLEDFRQGLTRLRDGRLEDALTHFHRAVTEDGDNPFYLSYKGLLLGKVAKRWADAEDLCATAIQRNHSHAQLYLNLAEVYLLAGRKEDAIDTLHRGLLYNTRDLRLRHMLEKLGTRRAPVLPFLPRASFVNRSLGKLRHVLVGPS